MRVRMWWLLCVLVMLLGAESATAAGESPSASKGETYTECKARLKNPIDCFEAQAFYAFTMCRLRIKIALLKDSEDFSCPREARVEMEPYYAAVAKTFAKKPAALALLKETYAYWQTSLQNLVPHADELKIVYDRRIMQRQEGLDERLNRLHLEK